MTRLQTARRLAKIKLRLDVRRIQGGSEGEPGVVQGLPGDMPSDTIARLIAEGRKLPVMVVPHIPSMEEWERQTSAYQTWLIRRASRIDDPSFRPLRREEIETACRCAKRGEPIPE